MKSFSQLIIAYIKQSFLYIKRPLSLFDNWAAWGRLNWMPDKWYLKLKFRLWMGKKLDLKTPKTYNEKLVSIINEMAFIISQKNI